MSDWIPLLPESEFPAGASRCFLVRGRRIAVFRTDVGWHGCDDLCPHAEAPLSDGWIEDGCVVCPWHGARFSLENGEALTPPAVSGVRIHRLEVENGILRLHWPPDGENPA
jgi:nitrite reductase/ring-hydroxylating ferredoxin subunit